MPRPTKQTELVNRINQIVITAAREIAVEVRRDLAEQVNRLVGGSASDGRGAARGAAPKQLPAGKGRRRRRGGPDAATMDRVLRLIQSKPGLRSEQIQKSIEMDPSSVKAALAKLRAAKRVKTKGERRATTYSAA